jgi:hypothetical protein
MTGATVTVMAPGRSGIVSGKATLRRTSRTPKMRWKSWQSRRRRRKNWRRCVWGGLGLLVVLDMAALWLLPLFLSKTDVAR